jgi:two-component system nitrogen regulation sensor histidine kinase NtrY
MLLFRNLVKLWFERRHKILGSRFKTKLVVAFLSLALAPAILIFLIASNLINTSIEGWFKIQVERPLDESMRVAQTFYERVQDEAVRHGQYVARTLMRDGLLTEDRREDRSSSSRSRPSSTAWPASPCTGRPATRSST